MQLMKSARQQVLEIFTDKMDFPWRLKAFGKAYQVMKGS